MANADVVAMLAKVPIFSELSKKELDAVARSGKEVPHREGAVLAKEGESGLGFFLILDGTATVKVGSRVRNRMGPGDFFGEISMLDGGPRTATVVAETPIRLFGMTQWVFKRLVEANPGIAMKMLRVMAGRLRGGSKDLTD